MLSDSPVVTPYTIMAQYCDRKIEIITPNTNSRHRTTRSPRRPRTPHCGPHTRASFYATAALAVAQLRVFIDSTFCHFEDVGGLAHSLEAGGFSFLPFSAMPWGGEIHRRFACFQVRFFLIPGVSHGVNAPVSFSRPLLRWVPGCEYCKLQRTIAPCV